MKLFKIKEKIGAFLLKEDGKISKRAILKAGIILGAVVVSSQITGADHNNFFRSSYRDGDCPGVDAQKWNTPIADDKVHWHTNAAHSNNTEVMNSFGKLTFRHDHCIETHSNESYSDYS